MTLEYGGIDLGGTNIRVGAIDENEELVFSYKEPTFEGVTTLDDLIAKMEKMIQKIPNYESLKGIGLGIPGSIDKDDHVVTAMNLKMLIGQEPLTKTFENIFHIPFVMDNDAKVAAYGEALKGKGKDKDVVCYVTISTGCGGGAIINKEIYNGGNHLGGYFPRIILDGEHQTDALISGRVLIEQAKEKMDPTIENVKEIFEAYSEGNEEAIKIVEDFKKYLVVLLINLSATFNPEIIILGGGVLKGKDYFLDDVKKEYKEKVHPLAKDTIIEVAEQEEPGLIGACLLAKYKR